MFDLPVGKALIAVYPELKCSQVCVTEDFEFNNDECCKDCCFKDRGESEGFTDNTLCGEIECISDSRHDGKHVIFKLIDLPAS